MSEEIRQMVEKYGKLTEKALAKVSIKAEQGSRDFERAEQFLSMAKNYFKDAKHFEQQNKPETALAAYSYAHAWLDAGVKAGFLDGKEDDKLFTLP